MRALYVIIMIGLALLAIAGLRVDSAAGASTFVLAVLFLAGMFGALLLGRVPTGRASDLWPVRMFRLWMEGTERKLKERAENTD